MKKFSILFSFLGLIVPSFTTHAMLRSFLTRLTARPSGFQHIRKITPPEYYDYDYHHNEWRIERWFKQKESIKIALKNTKNDPYLIKQIVNRPEYGKIGYTPLCEAAEMNDIDFAGFLLEHKAEINDNIREVHSSNPIFFSKTLEMTKFLHANGANMDVYNTGQGCTGGMNLLHAAIRPDNRDDRLFDYLLSQGFNPHNLTRDGDNLWHCLTAYSVRYCPENRLFPRVKQLHDLTINPYRKNKRGKSSIDILEDEIKEKSDYLSSSEYKNPTLTLEDGTKTDMKTLDTAMLNKLIRLRDDMKIIKTTQFIEK